MGAILDFGGHLRCYNYNFILSNICMFNICDEFDDSKDFFFIPTYYCGLISRFLDNAKFVEGVYI
jgi:hypothetical protein